MCLKTLETLTFITLVSYFERDLILCRNMTLVCYYFVIREKKILLLLLLNSMLLYCHILNIYFVNTKLVCFVCNVEANILHRKNICNPAGGEPPSVWETCDAYGEFIRNQMNSSVGFRNWIQRVNHGLVEHAALNEIFFSRVKSFYQYRQQSRCWCLRRHCISSL